MLVGADALEPRRVRGAAAAVRACVVVARGELAAGRAGRRRWSWAPSGWRCCPDDEAWLLARAAAAAPGPVRPRAGWSRSAAAAAAPGPAPWPPRWRWPPAPGRRRSWSTPIRWGGGLDLLLGAERGRRAALAGADRACAGAWPAARCWPRCPRSAGVHVLAAVPRRGAEPVPGRGAGRRRRGGAGGRLRPSSSTCRRAGPGRRHRAVLADADLAVLVVPGPAARGVAPPGCWSGTASGSPWAAAQLVVPAGARWAQPRHEVADVVGRPVLAELAARPQRGRRGASGASRPTVAARSPLGVGRPGGCWPSCRRRGGAGDERARAARPGPGPAGAGGRARRRRPGWPRSSARRPAACSGDDDVLLAVRDAVDELAGAGPLEPLLRVPGRHRRPGQRSRAGVDRPRAPAWSGRAVRFPDDDAVRRLAVRLAAAAGRRLDDAAPVGGRRAARRHPAARRAAAGVGQRDVPVAAGAAPLRATPSTTSRPLGALPGESGGLLRAVVARGWPSWSPAAPARARPRCCPRCWARSSPAERIVLCEDAAELTPGAPARRPAAHPAAQRRGRRRR